MKKARGHKVTIRKSEHASLPREGTSPEAIDKILDEVRQTDIGQLESRMMAGCTYPAGGDVERVAKNAYMKFFSTNPLYSSIFPSLVKMEREIVEMTGGIFHGQEARGSVTSGGSESILMGVKIARDRARELHPRVVSPEMVFPWSVHPAFTKAAHLLGITPVVVPLDDGLEVDVDTYKTAITDNTILLVGSAPSLTLGMVDPIDQLAPLALERDINFHVDSCVGGFFLPFAENLGYEVPRFDFRVPGVTTISADLHKFGYTAKGASTITSRDEDIYRHQPFFFGAPERPRDWYTTPSLTGTRPGGAIAAAWAVMRHLGEEGYMDCVSQAMDFMTKFHSGINAIPGLGVLGRPAMTVFGYGSTDEAVNIFAVADGLESRGWLVYREEFPRRSIRFMQSVGHAERVDDYLSDLGEVVSQVREGRIVSTGRRAKYN